MNPLDWIIHPRQTTANVRRRLRRDRIHVKVWLGWVILLVLVAVAVFATVVYWGWISNDLWTWLGTTPGGQDRQESNSTTLRNIGLVVAGLIALPLAVWRSIVAQQQAETAQQGLLNERYQRGAEMLGNDVLSVRLGGVYALQRLAEEHPEQYHVQIVSLFCALVRRLTSCDAFEDKVKEDEIVSSTQDMQQISNRQLREDVQAAMTAIGTRSVADLVIEKRSNFVPNLHGVNLSYANLSGANLSSVDFSNAILHRADFFNTPLLSPDLSEPILSGPNQPQARVVIAGEHIKPDLSGFESRRANLSGSDLSDADLSSAKLLGADLSGALLMSADFSGANISYANLYKAVLLDANLSELLLSYVDLSGALLGSADLSGAHLPGAKLYGANFLGACLQGTDLTHAVLSKKNGKYIATGLIQAQIDQVIVDINKPPSLNGIVDYVTKEPLVWRGKPLDDEA